MAAASYTTDLATHDDCTTITNFAEPTGMQDLNGAGEVDGDLAIFGTVCVSEAMRKTTLGALMTNPAARTLGTDEAFFCWFKWFAPNSLGTKANGGIRVLIGNTTANYRGWYVDGSDTYALGGWKNYAVDPRQTGLASQTQGSPNTTYQAVGMGVFCPTSTPQKGNSFTMDIIRYGRGELIVTDGDSANGFATFTGMAAENDIASTNQWGLFQNAGGSFLWKGLISLGTTATSVDFRDTNQSITIDNTEYVSTAFNRIEVNNASSNVDWTAITISSLSTRAPGEFEVIDNATVDINTCTFSDMSTFAFLSNSTITDTSFIRCGTVTQGGSTITSCVFTESPSASSVVVDDISLITTCDFTSDGSNNAIEWTGTPASFTWEHETTGYLAGSAGDFTTGTNANATLYINPTVASSTNITITVPSTLTVPSIRFGTNYTGTVTVEIQQKTIDITVVDEDDLPVSGALVWINDGTTTLTNTTTNASGVISQINYGGAADSTIRIRLFGNIPIEATLGTASGNVDQTFTLRNDPQQTAVPTLNNVPTINTGTSTININGATVPTHTTYGTMDTANDFYEYVMNQFATSGNMQFPVPLEAPTLRQYNWVNGWTFTQKDIDYKYLYGGSFTDDGNNLQWSNVRSVGTLETGTSVYFVQGVEASDTAFGGAGPKWYPDGIIDILVKVRDGVSFTQSTDDTGTNVDGGVWFFAREYTDLYDSFFVDLSVGGQSVIPLGTFDDANNQTASGTVAGYNDITLTFGTISRDLGDVNGAKNYEVEIDCAGRPLTEVYEYLKYITSFEFSATIDGDDGFEYRNADEANFSNVDNKQAPFGNIAGGRFFGAQGVYLTNVAAADINNYELISSDGTTGIANPISSTFSLTGLKDGTEVRLYESGTTTQIAGVETVSGGVGTSPSTGVTVTGTTDDNTFSYTYVYSADIDVFAQVHANEWVHLRIEGLTLSDTNQSIPVAQQFDRNYDNP